MTKLFRLSQELTTNTTLVTPTQMIRYFQQLQDVRRGQKLWPDNVYQKTYNESPQNKTTTFTEMSYDHGASDNMTNYW